MKTRARSKGMFWAVIFMTIGLILFIQYIFKVDLPILRILFGVFFVYLGFKLVAGAFSVRVSGFQIEDTKTDSKAIFTESVFSHQSQNGVVNEKFTTVFGTSVLDLSKLTEEDLRATYKIETAFGKTEIITDGQIPILANVEVGFSSVKVRDQSVVSIGNAKITTSNYDAAKPALKLNIETAFGSVEVK
jgi:predicted membrane protein